MLEGVHTPLKISIFIGTIYRNIPQLVEFRFKDSRKLILSEIFVAQQYNQSTRFRLPLDDRTSFFGSDREICESQSQMVLKAQ